MTRAAPSFSPSSCVVICRDGPNGPAARAAATRDHLAYIEKVLGELDIAGPLYDPEGKAMIGSIYSFRTTSLQRARELVESDPYFPRRRVRHRGIFSASSRGRPVHRRQDLVTGTEPVRRARYLSSGVVVLREESGEWLFLLLRAFRSWDFPKGMVEEGEEPLAAARREVREESTIEDLDFRYGESFIETGPYSRNKVARYYIANDPHRRHHAAGQSGAGHG